jgi:SOS response regulatory protein OraA/RecX
MYIKKQSENIGKKVASIKFLKKSVSICFEDESLLKFDTSTYVSGPRFYEGKVITEEEFNSFQESSEDIMLLTYLTRLASSGKLYSDHKLIEKMINLKKATYSKAKTVLAKAKTQGLFASDDYIHEYISEAKEKGFSKSLIVAKLGKEGYSSEEINKIASEFVFENKETDALVGDLFERYSSKNYMKAREAVFARLYKMGFITEECTKMIDCFLLIHPEVKENYKSRDRIGLASIIVRQKEAYSKKGLVFSQLKNAVITKLLAQRYDFDDIIKAWEGTKK